MLLYWEQGHLSVIILHVFQKYFILSVEARGRNGWETVKWQESDLNRRDTLGGGNVRSQCWCNFKLLAGSSAQGPCIKGKAGAVSWAQWSRESGFQDCRAMRPWGRDSKSLCCSGCPSENPILPCQRDLTGAAVPGLWEIIPRGEWIIPVPPVSYWATKVNLITGWSQCCAGALTCNCKQICPVLFLTEIAVFSGWGNEVRNELLL